MSYYKIAALYKFVYIADPQQASDTLLLLSKKYCILGALIVAFEGVNGTISGLNDDMDKFIFEMSNSITELATIEEIKFSQSIDSPFYRIRIRVKSEIVTMGCPEVNPGILQGRYVEPEHWNKLVMDPEVLVIDTRNAYEVNLGTFQKAINPETNTFREFPEFVDQKLDSKKHKKIAMFCTGGVRCEKASAYMLQKGFEEVFHLKGGILKYLEVVPTEESLWAGECFVFDQRAAVGAGVIEGQYEFCHACRHPLKLEDKNHCNYEDGVSCQYCYDVISDKKRQSARERNLQMKLAEERQLKHLGFVESKMKASVPTFTPELLDIEANSVIDIIDPDKHLKSINDDFMIS